MNPRNRAVQYRIVNGQRERLCSPCHRWIAHDLEHFYAQAERPFGLRSICKECLRASALPATHARNRKRNAHRQQQREFAKAAIEGRIPA